MTIKASSKVKAGTARLGIIYSELSTHKTMFSKTMQVRVDQISLTVLDTGKHPRHCHYCFILTGAQ